MHEIDSIKEREKRSLYTYLMYFKEVEKRVRKSITNLVENPSSETLKDFQIMEEQLRDLVAQLERFCVYFARDDVVDNENVKLLIESIRKLLNIYEKNSNEDVKKHLTLEGVQGKKKEHFVCSILGLNADIGDLLSEEDDELMSHQTTEFWIEKFMDDREKSMGHNLDLKQQFEHLGFTKVTAEYLTESLAENPFSNHQSAKYWATTYIGYLFKNNVLLNEQNVSQEEEDSDGDTEERQRLEIRTRRIRAGGNPTDSDIERKYRSQGYSSVQDVNYWFHGTDQESAGIIAECGIDLDKGKRTADFSSGSGFYVTPNYEFAEKWPKMMRKKNSAIIVFRNDKTILSGGKEFSAAEQKWKDMVRYYRNDKVFFKAGKAFDKIKYIFGPLTYDREQAKTNPTPRENYFQLCLKNQDLADDFFKKNIEEIVFFD